MDRGLRQVAALRPEVPALALAVDAAGGYALTSALDFRLRLWDLCSGQSVRSWDAGGLLYAIDLDARSDRAFLGAVSGVVVWNWSAWKFEHTFFTPEGSTQVIKYAGTTDVVLGAGEDICIRSWRVSDRETLPVLTSHTLPISALALDPSERFLLSGDIGGGLCLWDLTTGDCLRSWEGHVTTITAVDITSDGRWAVTVGRDRTMRLWDLNTGSTISMLGDLTADQEALAFLSQGRQLISGGGDGIHLWQLPEGNRVDRLAGPDVLALRLDTDGQRVVALGRRGTIWMWDQGRAGSDKTR